ncbi:LacI family DNA-binding transcriptional regulator [Streptomyces puniciscabiei]
MVARRAGVSPQTVSDPINSPGMLRPETLERVRRAIGEMGYRPSRAAQTLRTRSSRLIGYGIQPAAAGQPVLDGYEELIAQHEVDGFVLSGTDRGNPRLGRCPRRLGHGRRGRTHRRPGPPRDRLPRLGTRYLRRR